MIRAPQSIRFVAGTVKATSGGLEIHPTAVICEHDGTRRMIQPWVGASSEVKVGETRSNVLNPNMARPADFVADVLCELEHILAELLVSGLRRADSSLAKRALELARNAEAGGFLRLSARIKELAKELELKQHSARWSSESAARIALALAVTLRLASEIERSV